MDLVTVESERAILGLILSNNDNYYEMLRFCSVSDFADEDVSQCLRVCVGLIENGSQVNSITLNEVMKNVERDWLKFLVTCQTQTIGTIEACSKAVKEKAQLRNLVHTAQDVISMCASVASQTSQTRMFRNV